MLYVEDIDCEISVVSLPEMNVSEDAIVVYRTWTEVEAEFTSFYPLKTITSDRKKCIVTIGKIKDENAPLRAMINGQIVSVQKISMILLSKIISQKGDFVWGDLLGALGKYNLGVVIVGTLIMKK